MSDGQTPYDRIIYPDGAYAVAHPDRAAVIASLMGLKPPPVQTARILELGTGTGGHLIAIASQYPQATCVGVDYAQAQIRIARETIEAVGLTNITFHALDFLDLPDTIGEFDYIIAHGIFSWVPEEVRAHMLEIIRRHLSPTGVAYLSYNTYPGWRTLLIAADIMRYHTRNIEDPWEKAKAAREVIGELAGLPTHNVGDSDWEHFMKTYHEVLSTLKDYLAIKSDHVLLHDDLEETSRPFYYHEIIKLLNAYDLTYLADAAFSSNITANLAPEEQAWLKSVAHTFDETEQYLDFIRNRTFRTSLIVHRNEQFTRTITPLPIANFYVQSAIQRSDPQPESLDKETVHFFGPEGIGFATAHPVMIAALDILNQFRGIQIPFRDLVRRARETAYAYAIPSTTLDEDAGMIATTLLQFYSKSVNLIEFFTTPPSYVATLSEHPVASKYARYQAISNEMITNMRQNRVQLGPNARALISLLDGTNDREALIDAMMRLTLQPEGISESERREKVADEVDRLMGQFRVAAVLVG
ncbi:MAG: class I SAM-dependent methyltransferase [Anaerolineae bacterium]